MKRLLCLAAAAMVTNPAQAGEPLRPIKQAPSLGLVSLDIDAVADSGGPGPLAAINPVPVTLPDGTVLRLIASDSARANAAVGGLARTVTSARGKVHDGAGRQIGDFVLAGDDDGVYGALWTDSGAFELRGAGFDAAGRPVADLVPVVGPDPAHDCAELRPPARPAPALSAVGDDPGPAPAADPESVFRVLFVFMDDAAAAIGSEPAFAASAVESANAAYANSEIDPLRMELAGVEILPHGTLTTGVELLYFATGQGEGYLDEVHALADAYAADSVAIIGNINDVCGVAWLSPDDAEYGTFNVTDLSCAIGNLSFAHEVGHNQGCAHDPDNAGGAYFSYAFGHRWNFDTRRSVMAYAPGTRVPYFSNPDVFAYAGATGVADERDNARCINETDILVTNFRQGSGDPTDCDNSGTPDAVEIARGAVRDDNGNGVPDSCDIAAGATDCDGDGVIDDYQIHPNARYASGPLTLPPDGSALNFTTPELPEAAGEPVALDIRGFGDLSSTSEYYLVLLEDGVTYINAFAAAYADCDYTTDFVRLLIAPEVFNAMRTGGVGFTIDPTGDVNPSLCSVGAYVSVEFNYRATDTSADADHNGVLDACENPCVADINTTNTNPGDPAYGTPDGVVNGADLSYFVENWLALNNAVADLTTTNANPGDPGYGSPDGLVDGADLAYFVEHWLAGCA